MEEQPIKQQPFKHPADEQPARESAAQNSESRYIKFICNSCNYKFSMKRDSSAALRCPYCSGDNVQKDTFSLSRLIDES